VADIFYWQNTHVIYASNVYTASGISVSTASVIVTIVDAATREPLQGQTWPLTLSYLSATSGDYRGILSATLRTSPSQRLVPQVTMTADDATGYWELDWVVRVRD